METGDGADMITVTRIVQFLAIVLSALALIPAGAHLAALPALWWRPPTP